jgi:hypothetical protein
MLSLRAVFEDLCTIFNSSRQRLNDGNDWVNILIHNKR